MTKVVILCGGKGTRIGHETRYKPKPMIKLMINQSYGMS